MPVQVASVLQVESVFPPAGAVLPTASSGARLPAPYTVQPGGRRHRPDVPRVTDVSRVTGVPRVTGVSHVTGVSRVTAADESRHGPGPRAGRQRRLRSGRRPAALRRGELRRLAEALHSQRAADVVLPGAVAAPAAVRGSAAARCESVQPLALQSQRLPHGLGLHGEEVEPAAGRISDPVAGLAALVSAP